MTVAAKAKIIENVVIGTFEYYLYDDMTAAVSDLANRNGYGHYVIPSSVEYENKVYKVTKISSYAFGNCVGIKSIEIPNTVTEIGFDAFYGCSGLTTIKIPSSVSEIDVLVFRGCSTLKSIEVEDGNPNYKSINGALCSKDGTLIKVPEPLTSFTIPSEITAIEEVAFYASQVSSITVLKTVESIKNWSI